VRLVVVSVISPTAKLQGYLRRFLQEPSSGVFIGGATRDVADDFSGALQDEAVDGFMIVAADRSEVGFDIRYFKSAQRVLLDFDGVALLENHPRFGNKTSRK
jgi:CRISPR-associated endoribonuclease Cas2 subtype I-E